MKWKGFTPDEVLALRANPYTHTVTEKTISFTREFKERMWEGMQNGQPKRALVIELGYDPDILGPSRIEGIPIERLFDTITLCTLKGRFCTLQGALLIDSGCIVCEYEKSASSVIWRRRVFVYCFIR